MRYFVLIGLVVGCGLGLAASLVSTSGARAEVESPSSAAHRAYGTQAYSLSAEKKAGCLCRETRNNKNARECVDDMTFEECSDYCRKMGYYRTTWESDKNCFQHNSGETYQLRP